MSRRRTRFAVTFIPTGSTEPRTVHSLAYAQEWVEAHYARRGEVLNVARVQRGSRSAAPASSTPWTFDWTAIREACALMEVDFDSINFKATGHRGGRRGAFAVKLNNRTGALTLAITVKSWNDPAQASRTLWHELAHAMQYARATAGKSGRAAFEAWEAAHDRDRRVSYMEKSMEREAREYEAFADDLALVRVAA